MTIPTTGGQIWPGSGIAGVTIRKNTGANVGSRPRLNLIEGTNVTLTVTDDPASAEIDVTISASGVASGALVVLPLTTVVAGIPELVWDADDSLIPTIVPVS